MLVIKRGSAFKKDYKKIKNTSIKEDLMKILNCLVKEKPLDPKHRPHPLTGNYRGYMECHVRPDVLLVYRMTEKVLYLYRIGSHSSLF